MGRIRTIKPEFFLHEGLFDLEEETGLPIRLAFPGLWCQADREGRFKWQARKLKAQILPYDDIDFSRVLDALATRGFVEKYEISGVVYGQICGFSDHQAINNREKDSEIPPPPEPSNGGGLTREPRVDDATATPLCNAPAEREGNGKGKEQDIKDSCPEPAKAVAAPSSPPVIELPTNRFNTINEQVPITQAQVAEWQETYPAVDVIQSLREMRSWLINNPGKRKTASGMPAFVNRWLAKEQNRGGSITSLSPATSSTKGNSLANDLQDRSWAYRAANGRDS